MPIIAFETVFVAIMLKVITLCPPPLFISLYDVNKNIEMVYFERWKLHDK
jgi:hypothetical protein